MKLSLTIGKREFALSLGGGGGNNARTKTLSPDLQAWTQGMDVPDNDQGATLVSPYMQSSWVYTAVCILAKNAANVPFRVSRVPGGRAARIRALRQSGDGRDKALCRRALGGGVLDSGPCVELFGHPHPTMPRELFWEMAVTWLALRGEFFILGLDDEDRPVDLAARRPGIERMITLPPELFWHVVTGYTLEAWRYTGSPLLTPLPSEMLLPSEVIHSRAPNPYLYWRGMSPLLVAMLPAAADYAASMFQKGLLMNNADTGIIATTDQNLTQEQREQFMAALRERKRKAGTPDRPLFLSSGVKIEKPKISNVDMQFLETRNLLRQEICAIFGVPQIMMGFVVTRSLGTGQGEEQERFGFIENTITPICHRLEAAVQPIVRAFGDDLVGWFDVESLPVMQEARRTRADAASRMFGMGVPFNEINKVYDLGFADLPWGNTGFLPETLQAAGCAAAPFEGPEDGDDPETAGSMGVFERGLRVME
ncbi:MAG: phage portal protein [Verrucomicrobia bacterium]|nr:phage portal protein [Verrucomicrobiota bacterium]MDE3098196.1 phage portal protein [Verrucomicrobiota bacterium]